MIQTSYKYKIKGRSIASLVSEETKKTRRPYIELIERKSAYVIIIYWGLFLPSKGPNCTFNDVAKGPGSTETPRVSAL